MIKPLVGILAVALVATIGDAVWYELGVRHRMVAGILHGAVLLTAVGGVLGAIAGRFAAGLPLGMAAGVGGALAYYAIVAVGGRRADLVAMLSAWSLLWFALAVVDGRVLRRGSRRLLELLGRGAIAAALGGLAFYGLVDVLWGATGAGPNYLIQFLAWAIVWAPGILAIALDAPSHPDSSADRTWVKSPFKPDE
jgi:hypothetical protein